MTTRRGFIQGILAGIAALVLPKTAETTPIDESEELFLTEIGFSIEDWPRGIVKKPIYKYCTAKEWAVLARLDEILGSQRRE